MTKDCDCQSTRRRNFILLRVYVLIGRGVLLIDLTVSGMKIESTEAGISSLADTGGMREF